MGGRRTGVCADAVQSSSSVAICLEARLARPPRPTHPAKVLSDLASGGWLKRELCRIHSDTETAETVVDDALKALIVNMSEAGRLDLHTGLQKVLDMFPGGSVSGRPVAVPTSQLSA